MNAGWQTLAKRGPSAARHSWAIASPLLARRGTQPPCDAPEPCLRALPERLGEGGRLALGDPQHVPAGRYGHAALADYGLLPALKGRLLPADSVRTALRLGPGVRRSLGLGYASDARVLPTLRPCDHPRGRLTRPSSIPWVGS